MSDSDCEETFKETSTKIYPKGYNVHENLSKINTIDRAVPEVPEPAKHKLLHNDFWSSVDVPNAEKIKEHLKLEGISESLVLLKL